MGWDKIVQIEKGQVSNLAHKLIHHRKAVAILDPAKNVLLIILVE